MPLSNPITEPQIPQPIARDVEFQRADTAHLEAADPHPQYATQGRGDARYERLFSASFRATPMIGVTQTIPNNVETKINLSNEIEDTSNQYDASLSRLIAATTNETWRIAVHISFSLPTSGRLYLEFRRNNTVAPGLRFLDLTPNAGVFSLLINPIISLTPGDYLELFCNVAVNNAVVASNFYSHWSGLRIR